MSESDYVAQQAAEATAAMRRVAAELTRELGHGVDPRLWAKAHPWYTVAGAAVAGFATAAAAIPSKQQQAEKRLAALERALHPPAPDPKDGDERPRSKGSFLGPIVKDVVGILRPVVMSALAAGVSAVTADQQVDESMNADGTDNAQAQAGSPS